MPETAAPPRSLRPQGARDRVLVEQARLARTPAERRAAVEGLLPLARALARRHHRGQEPLEDLEQVAAIGLLKAIEGFDLARGTPFGAYATPTIVGELRRHYRDKGWTVRVPRALKELSLKLDATQERLTLRLGRAPTPAELAEHLESTVEHVLEARGIASAMRPVSLDRAASPGPDAEGEGEALVEHLGGVDDGYERVETVLLARDMLERLPGRERRILELRFGTELTQGEIGERLGISQMHVSRLLRSSLASLAASHGGLEVA